MPSKPGSFERQDWSHMSSYIWKNVTSSMPTSWCLSLSSVLHQIWGGKSTAVHPKWFSSYEVLLARPSAPLLRIFFVDNLLFSILPLVDDSHLRSFVCKLHVIMIADISLKTDQMEKNRSRFWNVCFKCIIAVVRFLICFEFFIWRKWWRKAMTFRITFLKKLLASKRLTFFFREK